MLAHLGAGAHGGPGIDHGALIHIGADVHVAGHEDGTLGDEAAAARHGRRHHAHAGGGHLVGREVRELRRHLVEEGQVAGAHDGVVLQAEGQQHGLFDPLVHRPLAHAFTRGHAQLAVVELGDHMLDGIFDLFGGGAGRQAGAVVPGVVYQGLQLLCHERNQVWERMNCTMRWAACRHSSASATRAMRTRWAPGLMPSVSRAR